MEGVQWCLEGRALDGPVNGRRRKRDNGGRGARAKGKRCKRKSGKRKAPLEVFLKGGANPATPYSPGPGGQVPSANRGLTSVFGMGTGVTLAQESLKQSLGRPAHFPCGG